MSHQLEEIAAGPASLVLGEHARCSPPADRKPIRIASASREVASRPSPSEGPSEGAIRRALLDGGVRKNVR